MVLSLRVVSDSSGGGHRLEGHGIRLNPSPALLADRTLGEVVRVRVVSVSPHLELEALPGKSGGVAAGKGASFLIGGDGGDGALSAAGTGTVGPRLGEGTVAALLNRLNVARIPFSDSLVSVILNSQRVLSPRLIAAISRRMEHWAALVPRRGRGAFAIRRRARALLESADRGMDGIGGEGDLEDLLSLLAGWSSESSFSEDEADGDRSATLSGEEPPRANDLAAYLTRATDDPWDPLQLFNHLRSTGDLHWIVLPVGARTEQSRTTGSLRVGLDRVGGTPRRATLGLSHSSGSWWFSWEIADGGVVLRSAQAVEGAPEIPVALLARLGGTRHTVTEGFPSGDGFSAVATTVPGLGGDEHG
jgi:hypothetical protein